MDADTASLLPRTAHCGTASNDSQQCCHFPYTQGDTSPPQCALQKMLLQAEYMQLVKEAFMEKDAMAVIVGLVAEPLAKHPRMTEADGLIVQLVITFIRNLLKIPDRAATAGQLTTQSFSYANWLHAVTAALLIIAAVGSSCRHEACS